MIPSLPPPGGSIGHHELMGRIRAPSPSGTDLHPTPDPGPERADQGARTHRPALMKRSSSMEDRPNVGNRAGVGAGRGHERNWSGSSPERFPHTPNERLATEQGKNKGQRDNQPVAGPGGVLSRTRAISRGRGHGRTWSDSTAVDTRSQEGSLAGPNFQARSVSPSPTAATEGCIKLGEQSDVPRIGKLLITLQALIPPSRTPNPAAPPPQTALLHPITLITPLAIILEALVVERDILKNSLAAASPRLPVLRDGSSLQLADGEGALDWRVTRNYMIAVGMVLTNLIRLFQHREKSSAVEEVMKTMRVYVGKMKKIFGEVATMLVDGYGFLKGWWDEGGMKGAAAEVGRWGDLLDA